MRITGAKAAAIALLLGILVILSFTIDFHVANSAATANSNIARFTSQLAPNAKIDLPRSMGIYVTGEGAKAAPLQRELAKAVQERLGFGNTVVLATLPEQMDRPVLAVRVTDRSMSWTPVYACSAVTVQVVYASDGDMSWRDDVNVVMGSRDGQPQLRVRGDILLTDDTRGLISNPAYERQIARQIAVSVSDSLYQQLTN